MNLFREPEAEKFFWNGIHDFPERWEKCVKSNGQYFE